MSYLIGDTCKYETDIKNKIDEKEYKIMSKNTYYGHALRTFEIENGRVSKATVRDVVGGVRNNGIVEKTREHGIGEWKVVNGSVFIYHDNNGNVYTEEEASEKISELEERIEDTEDRIGDLEEEMDKDIPDCNLQETEDKINELEQKVECWNTEIETLQEGEVREIYQYYIVPKQGADILLNESKSSELVLYNDELDMYVWCICFYGADWRDVLTDIPIPEQTA